MSGRIIYINGVTSTGKTSVSRELQRLAGERYFYFSDDLFGETSHKRWWEQNGFWRELYVCCGMMYKAARAIADSGFGVIIDGVLVRTEEMPDLYEKLLEAARGVELVFVELRCPPEECRRRNIERGNRGAEQSAWQAERMTEGIRYELSLDTSENTPERCAELILAALDAKDRVRDGKINE